MTTMYKLASAGELLKELPGDIPANRRAEHRGVARAGVPRGLNGRTVATTDLSVGLSEPVSLSRDFIAKAQLQYDLRLESRKKRPRIKPLGAKT